ncbi:MAG: DNA polymerase III subunit gamma/tau [Rhodothermia bacterium]|nr:DNA polymerase III subunit gamma/tau [Rhodothermia bacterium]
MSDQRYLVAARKYRPQRFDDVVAQEHVCETLKNAIERERLGHAYLFSGPRGVGKTTVARILAKSINCTAPLEDRDGAEPCQKCDSCLSFAEGRNLNVIEIDAASNNKVDDVRELRDTVRVPPQGGVKKVYIIDEVHMLSTSAFNALLKTLEEPPPYALFIFATTEPNKVLPTILSRCQRFDFRRIPVAETAARIQEIASEEKIQLDEGSLLLIAQKGDGALRDALSVFDQAVALCGSEVTYEALADALGVVDVELYFETSRCIRDRDTAGVLRLVQRIVFAGFDLQEFLSGLGEHFRNLLVALTMPDTGLIETSAAIKERYKDESNAFTPATLLRLLSIASDSETLIRTRAQPRLQLELGLLKMVGAADTIDLRQALAKIDALSERSASIEGPPATDGDGSADGGHAETSSPATKEKKTQSGKRPPRSAGKETSNSASQVLAAAEAASTLATAPTGGRVSDVVDPATTTSNGDIPSGSNSDPVDHPTQSADRSTKSADTSNPLNTSEGNVGQKTATAEEVVSEDSDASAEPDAAAEGTSTEQIAPRPDLQAPAPESEPTPKRVPDLFGPPALSRRSKNNGDSAGTIEGSAARSAVREEAALNAPNGNGSDENQGPASVTDWLPFVKAVKAERIHVGSLLQHTAPSALEASHMVIDVPDDFHKRLLENQQDFLLQHARRLISDSISTLRFVVRTAVRPPEGETAEDFDPYEYMKEKRQSNPVIRAIFDEFGGELVW